MSQAIVLGMQWGDEGKGKIVDLIGPAFDAVVRFQGGHNAGHTVKFGNRHFALHLVPSGILHEGARCVLGTGMVIAPDALRKEIEQLESLGIDTEGRIFVSDRAQIILPTHALLDAAREESRGGGKIGTTLRGIGPAYEMKAARCGLRVGDLRSERLNDILRLQHQRIAPELAALSADPPPKPSMLATTCREWGAWLGDRICDTTALVNDWMDQEKSILFEGAQGTLLDVDYGTYPYVTSSSTTAGGVCAGAGIAPSRITGVLGVIKAYVTRVGAGPFPTELDDSVAEHLQTRGNEFGTTTGRPRRCGWFDVVAARYAQRLSGIDVLALTKVDVLDSLDEICICTAYRIDGVETTDFPSDLDALARVEPVYESMSGWSDKTAGALSNDDLPAAARAYLARLEELVGVPIGIISSGPRREETIVVETPRFKRLLGTHGFKSVQERVG